MSKQQAPKKKVVVSQTSRQPAPAARPKTARPAVPEKKVEMVFNRKNYILLAAGAILMALGIALMAGGHMPDPNTWDESLIYSPRRMVLAPILMLTGLVVEVFAIFRQ